MNTEKARQFLTEKGWDKNSPTVGGALFEGIAQLLSEYEEKNISSSPPKEMVINTIFENVDIRGIDLEAYRKSFEECGLCQSPNE